jgi:thymidylate kinase
MQIIVVTGMDGAGKTTLIQRLMKQLAPLRTATLHLPFSGFVSDALARSGGGKPSGDVWTDRLVFALDNRLAAYEIEAKKRSLDVLIMQRGWMDSYIYGSVQGIDYGTVTNLVRPADLPKVSGSLYLNCSPDVAYERIKNNPANDKFETPAFMKSQHYETEHFYQALETDPILGGLFSEPRYYLDTTLLNPDEVELEAIEFLKRSNLMPMRKEDQDEES